MTTPHPTPAPLLDSMERNLQGHVAFLQRRTPGMTVREGDGLLLVDSGLANDTFNKILGAALTEDDAEERIDEALGHFRTAERPFTWWVGPCSRPLDLEDRLVRRGLVATETEEGMAIELDRLGPVPLPDGIQTRRVRTRAELQAFAGVLAGLGGAPDPTILTFYDRAAPILLEEECPMVLTVAYAGSEPAAVCELFLGGGVAGVHMVATREGFRRRGLGLAMTWTALQAARGSGIETAVLQASPEGQGVYERLGFRSCCRFVEYGSA